MNDQSTPAEAAKFGMFKGVFTPSILTILGVIMYLRFGWVVGQAGLVGTVVVVILAHVVSFTTGMSISSIATNRTVKTGGDYYMISRSLGLPIGGAIGLVLFFALSFSTSLYLLGFAESFLSIFGLENTLPARRLVGTLSCVLITGLTLFSTSLALKLQYFVLAAIALSLVSLFTGVSNAPPAGPPPLWFGEGSASLEMVFSVFFPAVTGFTAGVAMSGDLKDPRKALPLGTMLAIFVGLAIYLIIPVFLIFNVDSVVLREDPMVWLRVSSVPVLVYAGVFAATLSSALGSVLGAPRYLQALALDGVAPAFLGKGYGPLNEPRIGAVVTFLIAQAGILLGELDLIARVVTMFFLTSYGFLCLAAGLQAWSGIPSYRPSFKTPVWVSLLGAGICFAMMFKLDTMAMIGAVVVMFGIFTILKRRQFRDSPGDTWGGFWAAVVHKGVLRLHRRPMDAKNWRPNALVFGGLPSERQHLVYFAQWLFGYRGLATYFYIIEGDVLREAGHARLLEPSIRDIVGRAYPQMLSRVAVAPDVYEGIVNAAQSYGISGMMPNTVLLGWGEESEHPAQFTALVRKLIALDHNLLLLEYDRERSFGKHQSIDIWWRGLDRNGELMLLLGFLLTASSVWAKAEVRINTAIDHPDKVANTRRNLERIIGGSRIKAQANVIAYDPSTEQAAEVIARVSSQTELVIMGLRLPIPGENSEYVAQVSTLINPLGSVLLVRASSAFEGGEMLFDEDRFSVAGNDM